MKFKLIILFIAIIQLTTKANSQSISLSLKNASIEEAFKAIENQTTYSFIYGRNQLKQAKLVNLDVSNERLETILELIFKDQPLTYTISGKYIAVKEKPITEKKEDSYSKPPVDVKGRVVNEKGEPVIASVTVKGTNRGTGTNENGEFELQEVDEDAVLIISGINIEPLEIRIAGKKDLSVIVKVKITEGEEVFVNAGYYKVKDAERTGSISKVDAKTIEKQPVTNPLAAISGRMPGVYIQQASGTPGGDFRIQIRGRNSLRPDGNEPLYIIDGVPFSTEKTFSFFTNTGSVFGTTGKDYGVSRVSPLTSINPSDIESIEVLKDADATAIYGSRGANGVVLITTKKGKAGKTKFEINIYSGAGRARKLDLLNTKQYLQLRREAFTNDGLIPSADPNDNTGANGKFYAPDLMVWDTTRYTNWQKLFLGAANTTSVQASISGGNEQTQFLFGLGYRSENSIYPDDLGYQKSSFHLVVNHQSANKKFSINVNVNTGKDKNDQPVLGLVESRRLIPNAPALYDANGKLNWENSTWLNPLADLEISYRNNVVNLSGNTVIGYEPLPALQFKTSFGVSYLHSEERFKKPSTYYDPAIRYTSAQSIVHDASGTNQSWIIEPQLNWERKIKKGKLTILVGSTFQEQQLERKANHYEGFSSDELLDNLTSASISYNLEYVQSLYRYMAIFGRANYNWDGKYILNLTGRRDASSRFGPGRQFANFGAAGAAWIFSKAKWIEKNISFLSFGKLRASYGITGSDQIGNYQYLDTYASGAVGGNQYQGVTFLSPLRLFNANYSWETNKKFEAAIELGFFRDRISLAVSYFKNRSSNQLVNYTLPQTTGFSGILANLPATVQNTGWEGELTTENLSQKIKIQWTTSFNITIPRNKLIEFPNLESSTYANTYVVGMPLSIIRVFESTGVDAQTGLWTFRDVNGDGLISNSADRTKMTFVGQDFFGGLNNNITYKGWSLDFLFQFVKQTGLGAALASGMPGRGGNNSPAFLLDKKIWRKPGDNAEIQRLFTNANIVAGTAYANYHQSDAVTIDASFIRLKNVSLSYQLPKKWTKDISCQIYFHAQNLLLITHYEGDDPENQNYNILPPLKMLTAGAQFTF